MTTTENLCGIVWSLNGGWYDRFNASGKGDDHSHIRSDDVASVYTFDKRLKVQLKRLSEKFPELIYPGKKAIEGAVNYIVPKSCIVIYTPYSDERKRAASKRAKTRSDPRNEG